MRKQVVILSTFFGIMLACFASYLLQRNSPEPLRNGERLKILDEDHGLPEVTLVGPIVIHRSGFEPDAYGYFQLTDAAGHEFRLINESAGEAFVEGHSAPGLRRFVRDETFYRLYYTVMKQSNDYRAKDYINAVWPMRFERIRRNVSGFLAD
jgi:hypothetical protein